MVPVMDARGASRAAALLVNTIIFGGFALVVIFAPGPRRRLEIVLLLALAFGGYLHAFRGRRSRAVGTLAFVAGWFLHPLPALLGLGLLELSGARRGRTPESPQMRRRADLARLTLRTVLEEPGRIRAFREGFTSPEGAGEIALLMATEAGEVAFYFESGVWNDEARERFFEWMRRLRASNRASLPVEVRGTTPVPDDVFRACRAASRGEGGAR
jgi:hypothetical protein